jgi:hypothetical protein
MDTDSKRRRRLAKRLGTATAQRGKEAVQSFVSVSLSFLDIGAIGRCDKFPLPGFRFFGYILAAVVLDDEL